MPTMNQLIKSILIIFATILIVPLLMAIPLLYSSPVKGSLKNYKLSNPQGLSPKLLQMGLNAYQYAKAKTAITKPYLTIVDLNTPSKDKRMWVIDLNTHEVVAKTLVANGKCSGRYEGTTFSNKPGSDQSSLGVYVTGNLYDGKHGQSMRVIGLEKGINSNAYNRAIVMHPAPYVSEKIAKEDGRVGNSWGCFALNRKVAPEVIHLIHNGSVIFAYGKSENNDPAVDGAADQA